MDQQEYKRIFDLEDHHDWYRGLHELVLVSLRQYLPSQTNRILDVGCGTGGILNQIQYNWTLSCGLDISKEALKYCKKRTLSSVFQGSASQLPFPNCCFDAALCIHVIYHQHVQEDQVLLKECHRILKPGCILILHAPAFSFLKGAHDQVVHTRMCYTRPILQHRLLSRGGFDIVKISYRTLILMPIMFLKRLFSNRGSDLSVLPGFLNWVVFFSLHIENQILPCCSLPLGTSVFCIAQKPSQ